MQLDASHTSSCAAPPLWQVWLLAARPKTLLAAIVPVGVATALAARDGHLHHGIAAAAMGGAMAIQIATNLFNDYADSARGADTSERIGPKRAAQQGWLLPRTLLIATASMLLLATLCGFYLLAFGSWTVVCVGLASMLSALAYTGGPYPLGYHGLGDVFVFVFFGLVAVCTTYLLQVGSISALCWAAASAVGAWATALLVVNNLRDRHTDKPAGKRTTAVRLGPRFARAQYTALTLWPYVVTASWSLSNGASKGVFALHAPALLPLISAPLAAANIKAIYTRDGAALNALLGRTALGQAVWGALFAAGVLL